MKDFLSFIKEGMSSDANHDMLDNGIWSQNTAKEPILLAGVYKQIMMDVEVVRSIVNVEKVYIIGDLLTTHYLEKDPLDVYLIIEKHWVSNIAYERLMKFVKSHSGDLVFKTMHPLKYYVEIVEDDDEIKKFEESFPAIYDLLKQKWLKIKVDARKVISDHVSVFLGRVMSAGLDTGARIDWKYFLDLDEKALGELKTELQSKAFEIYRELSDENDLVKKTLRRFSYGSPPTVEEIEKLYDKEKIPYSIISKMLIQYYIYEYIKRIDDKIGKGKDTHDNELPPGGETINRTDPFPNENLPESKQISPFSEFLVEKGLRPLYKPRGTFDSRKSGVSRGLSTKSKSEKMTTKNDDKRKIVVNNGVMHGDALAAEMKKHDFGCVPITTSQEGDIEAKYNLSPLTAKNPFRRLGKTDGMAIVKNNSSGGVFLVKNKMLDGIGGGIKK